MRQTTKSFFAGIGGVLFVLIIFLIFQGIQYIEREFGSPITCMSWQYLPVRLSTTDARVIENCTNPSVLSLTVYFDEPGYLDRQISYGSAFYVTSDGYAVTSAHVVSGENVSVRVREYSGKWRAADVIASDSVLDVALIKIDVPWTQYLKLANSEDIDLGETAYAFGFSLGEYENSIVKGIVSGLNRNVSDADSTTGHIWKNLIQTDAGISSGNSGGPLVDSYGRVLGVNTATSEGSDNVGFALPANAVKAFIAQNLR